MKANKSHKFTLLLISLDEHIKRYWEKYNDNPEMQNNHTILCLKQIPRNEAGAKNDLKNAWLDERKYITETFFSRDNKNLEFQIHEAKFPYRELLQYEVDTILNEKNP